MLFFFKNKKIVLDCFTSSDNAYNLFKIEPARKFIPSWWKNLPATYKVETSLAEMPTMRTCLGINNNFKHGFIMPLWAETVLTITQVGHDRWIVAGQGADAVTQVVSHHPSQWGDFIDNIKYMHIKISAPWLFKCNEDINWMWSQPSWNIKDFDEYSVLPGIIDFKYQSNANINMIARKLDNNNQPNLVTIPAGQPMVHLLPITERKVEIRNHLVSHEEWNKINSENSHISYINSYAKKKHIHKKIESESKCPFKFGRK
jgi:hypothetical protein